MRGVQRGVQRGNLCPYTIECEICFASMIMSVLRRQEEKESTHCPARQLPSSLPSTCFDPHDEPL